MNGESPPRPYQPDDSGPLVSVVILSYNRPESLQESLECVFNQSYRNLEVLVMDNSSACPNRIRKVVERFSAAKLYFSKSNVGYTGGMNAGVKLATGKYVYLTEDDMYSEPECVERMVRYVESDPSAGIVSGSVYARESGLLVCCGGEVRLGPVFSWNLCSGVPREDCPIGGPYCAGYTTGAMMFFSRERFIELGGFRNDFFMYYEDTELCLRARARGYPIVIVPDATAYNWRAGNAPETATISYHKFKNFMAAYLLHARAEVLPEFLLRYGALAFFRELRKGIGPWLSFLRGLGWVVFHTPALLLERARGFRTPFPHGAKNMWRRER